jgi:hypothetical protein
MQSRPSPSVHPIPSHPQRTLKVLKGDRRAFNVVGRAVEWDGDTDGDGIRTGYGRDEFPALQYP